MLNLQVVAALQVILCYTCRQHTWAIKSWQRPGPIQARFTYGTWVDHWTLSMTPVSCQHTQEIRNLPQRCLHSLATRWKVLQWIGVRQCQVGWIVLSVSKQLYINVPVRQNVWVYNYARHTSRLALSIAICAVGETVFYLAKINKNSSPNWRNVIFVIIIDVIIKTWLALFNIQLCWSCLNDRTFNWPK